MSISSKVTRQLRERHLLLVVPADHVDAVAALREAYGEGNICVDVRAYVGRMPTAADLARSCERHDAVLLAGSARYAPRTVLPGPFLVTCAGRRVPAAWLPLKNSASTNRFAATVAHVHRRPRQRTTVALLGQWHPRYLHLADRIETLLARHVETYRWTADVIGRDDVVKALETGLGLGLYVGHGRAVGWVGYRGMRAQHFDGFRGDPLGGILSVCCRTASRRRVGLSYAESLPLRGVAAAAFGAIAATLHTDNTRWVVGLCEMLKQRVESVGELVIRSAPLQASASAPYRLLGDPLAPVSAAFAGAQRASAVRTYP